MNTTDLVQREKLMIKEVQSRLVLLQSAYKTYIDNSNRKLFPNPNDFEIPENTSIQQIFESVFEFAVTGKVYEDNYLREDDMYDAASFILTTNPPASFYNWDIPKECEHLYVMAIARYKLDCFLGINGADLEGYGSEFIPNFRSDDLTLKEVACIANMHEKSVRNATHIDKEDRLETFKVESCTYVTAENALDWLYKRQSFVPTTNVSYSDPAIKNTLPTYAYIAEDWMSNELENAISNIAEKQNFKIANRRSKTSKQIRLFTLINGREESIYIDRKAALKKGALQITLHPDLSIGRETLISAIYGVTPHYVKNNQREVYSSNFSAFSNKGDAKAVKNEHFGHAWHVAIDESLLTLSKFLSHLSA
ncbi:hypothetical protein [Neptunomonas sp.]|uniref:hypothetical protein n=1 Tax=Neptunomonas sp. TaxID=1971898 RepID=UPI0035694AE1